MSQQFKKWLCVADAIQYMITQNVWRVVAQTSIVGSALIGNTKFVKKM